MFPTTDMTTLKVKNNTNEVIKQVQFTYDSKDVVLKLNKIKPNSNKVTGVRTVYDVKDLIMTIDGLATEYLIRSEIPKYSNKLITISINSIDSESCEFDITEEQR